MWASWFQWALALCPQAGWCSNWVGSGDFRCLFKANPLEGTELLLSSYIVVVLPFPLKTHLISHPRLGLPKVYIFVETPFASDKPGRTLFCDSRSFGKTYVVDPTSNWCHVSVTSFLSKSLGPNVSAIRQWRNGGTPLGAARALQEASKLKDVTLYLPFQYGFCRFLPLCLIQQY